jgi:hypothetical protein
VLKTRDHIVIGIISIIMTVQIHVMIYANNIISSIFAGLLIGYAWNFFHTYAYARKLQEDKRKW